MNKLDLLQQIKTKQEFAKILGVKTSFLTYILYKLNPATQYLSFTIPQKSGGMRTIQSPFGNLKSIQSSLSELLLDCIDEINESKQTKKSTSKRALSHGFVRERSILTNAMMHLNQKNILNIDLKDFFDSFNFGRVRGFL